MQQPPVPILEELFDELTIIAAHHVPLIMKWYGTLHRCNLLHLCIIELLSMLIELHTPPLLLK